MTPRILGLLALPAVLLAAPAAAEPVTIRVAYGDLDLATAQGVSQLETRLDRASRRACQNGNSMRSLADITNYRECLAELRGAYREKVRIAAAEAGNARRVSMLADKIMLIGRI